MNYELLDHRSKTISTERDQMPLLNVHMIQGQSIEVLKTSAQDAMVLNSSVDLTADCVSQA